MISLVLNIVRTLVNTRFSLFYCWRLSWAILWNVWFYRLKLWILLISEFCQKEKILSLSFSWEQMRAFWVEWRESTNPRLIHMRRVLNWIVTQHAVNWRFINDVLCYELLLTIIILDVSINSSKLFRVRSKKILLFDYLFGSWLLILMDKFDLFCIFWVFLIDDLHACFWFFIWVHLCCILWAYWKQLWHC